MRERASLTLAALLLLAAIVVTVGAYTLSAPVWASPAAAPVTGVFTTCGTPLPEGAEVVGTGAGAEAVACDPAPAR